MFNHPDVLSAIARGEPPALGWITSRVRELAARLGHRRSATLPDGPHQLILADHRGGDLGCADRLDAHPHQYELASTHLTSEGLLVYSRCTCGALRVALLGWNRRVHTVAHSHHHPCLEGIDTPLLLGPGDAPITGAETPVAGGSPVAEGDAIAR